MVMDEFTKQEDLEKKLNYFLKKNVFAVKFCMDMIYIAHLWDDLVDKDKNRTSEDISTAFKIIIVGIGENPFYTSNYLILKTTLINIILQWEDANVLEKSENEHDVQMSWMLRAGIIQLISTCAFLVGGWDWSKEIGPSIRRLYEEILSEFLEEMKCQI